ncbi:MAG: hypothetical protein KDD84_21100 [Caldilineaceae bacterium]|nr:hypothetical protein [Caldilineaceae bacterium]
MDGGATWTVLNAYYPVDYSEFTLVQEEIPAAAQTDAIRFRWRQISHSGSCCDHWAIERLNYAVGAGGGGAV